MRTLLLVSFVISFHFVSSQECLPEKRKDKRLVNKIENQIARGAFYTAWDELRTVNDFPVFSALRAEILLMQN